jgi:hypothetical protein
MKKYNTPEIEALALETIDVIAASNGNEEAKLSASDKLGQMDGYTNHGELSFSTNWNW